MFSTCVYATDSTEPNEGNDSSTTQYIKELTFSDSTEAEDDKVDLSFSWTVNEDETGLKGVVVSIYKDDTFTSESKIKDIKVDADAEKKVVFEDLDKNVPYFVTALPYCEIDGEEVFGAAVNTVGIYLTKPSIADISATGTVVEGTIEPVDNATKYLVSYTIDGTETTFETAEQKYSAEGLEQHSEYTFKVAAVYEYNDVVITSDWSEPKNVSTEATVLGKPESTLAAYNKGAIISWNKVPEATGYEVWRYYKGTKKWSHIATVEANTFSHTSTGLKVGSAYSFMVRAIREADGEVLIGPYSTNKSISIKEYLTGSIRMGYNTGTLRIASKPYKENSSTKVASNTKIKRGTKVTILKKQRVGGKSMAYVRLSNGKTHWLKSFNIKHNAPYTTKDYTTEAKEDFVNNMKYGSDTNYLLFISIYANKVYLFKGSRGNWELQKTYKCCTGKATTRTPQGSFKLYKKAKRTALGSKYVSYFQSKNAFHAQPPGSKSMSKPVSNGCIRLYKNDALYIYNNIPKGTRVVAY